MSQHSSHPSDKVHVLRAGRVETFPPNGNVKAAPAATTKVGVSQTLVEVETGAGADDLIFIVNARHWKRHAHMQLTSASMKPEYELQYCPDQSQ